MQSKFTNDMIYGILKSKDILLSSIADALLEKNKKANIIDRLSNNLSLDLSENIDTNYRNLAMDTLGNNPVFLVDLSVRKKIYRQILNYLKFAVLLLFFMKLLQNTET